MPDKKFRWLRGHLWFAVKDETTLKKIKEYYTQKAIDSLIKYGYIEEIL